MLPSGQENRPPVAPIMTSAVCCQLTFDLPTADLSVPSPFSMHARMTGCPFYGEECEKTILYRLVMLLRQAIFTTCCNTDSAVGYRKRKSVSVNPNNSTNCMCVCLCHSSVVQMSRRQAPKKGSEFKL